MRQRLDLTFEPFRSKRQVCPHGGAYRLERLVFDSLIEQCRIRFTPRNVIACQSRMHFVISKSFIARTSHVLGTPGASNLPGLASDFSSPVLA